MSCQPSPVALRLWHDTQVRYGTRVTYAGIVGDANHQTRVSGHNCGALQESPLDGVDYDDNFAHALDIHVGGDHALGMAIVQLLIADPRTRYCIFDGVGYRGLSRGGGTFESYDHTVHVHWSGMPGTTNDTRPFYVGTTPATDPDEDELMAAADDIQRDIRLAAQVQMAATGRMLEQLSSELRAAMTRKHERTRRVIVEQVVAAFEQTQPAGAQHIDVDKLVAAIDAAVDDKADELQVDVAGIIAGALEQLPQPPQQ